ncbi:uncharacterized protein METZ01_LOCUS347018 [marine metagenome]|uniref:Uncharacterized protein n=1 Tax=marine metagenome TaxID=408172 RepID=A0A382R8X1_9ZZZZ
MNDGGTTVTEVGFILSNELLADLNSSGAIRVESTLSDDLFTASTTIPELGNRFHYRAYAINAKGISLGATISFDNSPTDTNNAWWASAQEAEAVWRISPWFGTFIPYDNGWIYHADLGWLFAQPDAVDGLWVWSEGKGWLWTNPGSYRYLYQADASHWLYFLKRKDGPSPLLQLRHGHSGVNFSLARSASRLRSPKAKFKLGHFLAKQEAFNIRSKAPTIHS